MSTDLAIRKTLPALVAAYKQSEAEIRQAYDLLESAEQRLKQAFIDIGNCSFSANPRDYSKVGPLAADMVMDQLKVKAWRVLVERMELRRVLSVQSRKKLDDQLQNGTDLPEITEENIVAMLQDSFANFDTYMKESITEVFNLLRPAGSGLKTNSEYELGKRVILRHAVDAGFTRGTFRIKYRYEPEIMAIDNVFSVCDGRGTIKTHHGPLCDGINGCTAGTGETEYFRFKCCLNGNLHIEFKRLDLVARLNATAGGNKLKGRKV